MCHHEYKFIGKRRFKCDKCFFIHKCKRDWLEELMVIFYIIKYTIKNWKSILKEERNVKR